MLVIAIGRRAAG